MRPDPARQGCCHVIRSIPSGHNLGRDAFWPLFCPHSRFIRGRWCSRFAIHHSAQRQRNTCIRYNDNTNYQLRVDRPLRTGNPPETWLRFLLTPASSKETQSQEASRKGVLAWAVAVGLVPCPAVVMVMLFCLSMDAMILGLLLAACISMGMATTISLVVITIIMGKAGILNAVSKNYSIRVEGIIGVFSGGAISIFGTLFFYRP